MLVHNGVGHVTLGEVLMITSDLLLAGEPSTNVGTQWSWPCNPW